MQIFRWNKYTLYYIKNYNSDKLSNSTAEKSKQLVQKSFCAVFWSAILTKIRCSDPPSVENCEPTQPLIDERRSALGEAVRASAKIATAKKDRTATFRKGNARLFKGVKVIFGNMHTRNTARTDAV